MNPPSQHHIRRHRGPLAPARQPCAVPKSATGNSAGRTPMPASGRAVGREMNLPAKKHFMQSSVTAGVPHPPPPLLRGAFLGLVMRFQLQGFDRQRQWRRWCTVGGQIRRRRRHPGASGPCAPERCSHSWLVHVSTAGTKLKQHVHMGCRFTAPHDAATGHPHAPLPPSPPLSLALPPLG